VRSHGFLRLVSVSLAAAALAIPARAADILFPAPLHLTRQLHDSIGNTTTTVDQYCYGNRVVTVRGAITTIADYAKGELTEIDREAGTYSVTRFDDLAKALRKATPPALPSAAKSAWKVRGGGLNQIRTNRATDAVEAELDEGAVKRTARVAVDRSVSLSRDALDVLIGSAYPNEAKPEDHVVREAAKPKGNLASLAQGTAAAFALPVEQHVQFEMDGERAEMRDVVTRLGQELAPADLVSIPPGAKLVESRIVVRMQAIEMLDNVTRTLPKQP
jgi:hypothetical protein